VVQIISIRKKFALFGEYWSLRIIAELNDSYIKLVKIYGEFVWHKHENADELFLVQKENLKILL
jgi:hypothetical protein